MVQLLIVLHIIVCLALIAIVLLQGGGKGAEMGASFGAGSSQTVFGATGGQSFIAKLTTGAAVIFMLTSLILAYFHGLPGVTSMMPEAVAPTQTEAPATPAAPVPATESKPATDEAKK
jgi:preprotein translocase subunit SecG